MKVYAKQVPPEYQDSRFDFSNYENIILTGNRHYGEYFPDWAKNIGDTLTEAFDALHDLQSGKGYYDTFEDVLADLFPPHERGDYTREERKRWTEILKRYNEGDFLKRNGILCSALSLLTGSKWDWCDLNGSSQGEWIECFYMEGMWHLETLEVLEAEFFNTGTEWHITEDEHDIGYYQYCTGWSDDMIRNEIAETTGANPSDIILLKFTGWNRFASYEEVIA